MRINRYTIPKLPRNKYNQSTKIGYTSNGGGGTTIINNNTESTQVYDGLDSTAIDVALSANQGRILDNEKLSRTSEDTALGRITFQNGLKAYNDVRCGGFNDNGNTGIGAAFYKNYNDWNCIADDINARKKLTAKDIVTTSFKASLGTINTLNSTDGNITNLTSDKATIGTINALNGIHSDGNITLGSDDIGITKDADGHWKLTIDNAKVKGRLDVQTLAIEQAKYIGGKLYCTKAAITVDNIASSPQISKDVYRCIFKNTDSEGRQIYNQFEVGDLAFCQTWHNNGVKRYWREVVGKGNNYIDLSKAHCETDSDEPAEGDDIVQLGNLHDPARQGALVIEPLMLNVYKNIRTYLLPSPTISINTTLSKINAQLINADTNENITTTFSNMNNRITAEADKIHYDDNGDITNINKNGLMLTSEFSKMFSQAVDKDNNIVKQAEISTFIDTDEANNLISNATIQADKINFNGKTIINNNFKVDEVGNLDINGKITTNEGKIGQFDITEKGLYNDAANGIAEIEIVDSREYTQKDFTVGKENSRNYLCQMSNRNFPTLNVVSEHGTALTCYSDTDWSLKASKSLIEGLHLGVTIINDNTLQSLTATETYITSYNDIIGLGYSNADMRIYLPAVTKAKGKILIIKNFTDHAAHIWSNEKTSNIVAEIKPQIVYNMSKGENIMMYCDGTYWFKF